jgi:hypothetical protein
MTSPFPADNRAVTTNQTEESKMLLASAYDQSRYFKATDMQAEKKLRIKDVTEEEIGVGQDKEKKLCVWFTNDPRGLVLNKTNNRTLRGALTAPVGRGRSLSCTPPPMSSGAAWFRFSECASRRPKKATGKLLQRSRSRQRRRRTQSCSTTS